MLNICGSNFVPIIITLICCAGLFMYFNLRLAEIKVAVEKQNRVLTAFITNVQEDIRSGGTAFACASQGAGASQGISAGAGQDTSQGVGMNHMAAPEAIIAAQKFEHDKIVVSDDEDSDSDSDEESDEESDCDSEEEGECEAVVPTKPNITMHDLNVEQIIPLSFEVLPVVVDLSGATETAFDLSITEISDGALNVLGETVHVGETVISEAVHVGETVHDETAYSDMKVDELRKIVSDKSLATKEEVKKLKKPELLLLLKK